jgi:hypothetical protein
MNGLMDGWMITLATNQIFPQKTLCFDFLQSKVKGKSQSNVKA